MAIVFSSRINGNGQDTYSANNYYTGKSPLHLPFIFLRRISDCASDLVLIDQASHSSGEV